MRVYRLEPDVNHYQPIVPVNRGDSDIFDNFDGSSITAKWRPVKMAISHSEAELEERLSGDFPSLTSSSAIIFSLNAAECLRPMLEANGELLPLLCSEGDFVVYNVTTVSDALDEERSSIIRFKSGRIMDIKEYRFNERRLGKPIIFKLRQSPRHGGVFVSDEFVQQVHALGLKGFEFVCVWDSDSPCENSAPSVGDDRESVGSLLNHPQDVCKPRPRRERRPRPDFTAMFSGAEPDEELLKLIEESGLPQAEQLKALLLPSVRFYATRMADSEIAVGRSKLGGAPDLGPGLSWPMMEGEPLAFLAQVSLAEVSELGLDSPLPRYGMLYFFHAEPRKYIAGTSPEEKDGFRVLFHQGFTDELSRSNIPVELPKRARYRPCLLEGEIEWTIPPWESEQVDALGLSSDESDLYDELETHIWHSRNNYDHRLFGYPDQIQGSVAAACEVGSTDADFSSPDLAEDALHWTLLMQINTEESAGMVWGDGGCLYFCIRDEDLLSLTFENAWMVMQCG